MSQTAENIASTTRARIEALVAELTENGDLENLVHLARLVGSAEDALTDDMIGRLAGIAGGGLDMLDRVNRSGVIKALPAIAQLVENGDLERIVALARLVGSAEDALTDDMIGRLARLASEGLSLFDRLTRSDGFMGRLRVLERADVQEAFTSFLEAVCAARVEAQQAEPSTGGLGGLLKLAREPQTQDAMRFMVSMANHLNKK